VQECRETRLQNAPDAEQTHLAVDPDSGNSCLGAGERRRRRCPRVGFSPDQISCLIAAVTADRAYDGGSVYRTIAAPERDAAAIIRLGSASVPGDMAETAPAGAFR
jgi:hypothetical protein